LLNKLEEKKKKWLTKKDSEFKGKFEEFKRIKIKESEE